MAISKFERSHGVVLSQVVRNPGLSLKLFERREDLTWGEYEVSDNQHVYRLIIKSTENIISGRGGKTKRAQFIFTVKDINYLSSINSNILICLVCADEEICTLERKDIDNLGILKHDRACNVSVSWGKGTELSVKSGALDLDYKIPRNRLKTFSWV
jgi:hypothetical protein